MGESLGSFSKLVLLELSLAFPRRTSSRFGDLVSPSDDDPWSEKILGPGAIRNRNAISADFQLCLG